MEFRQWICNFAWLGAVICSMGGIAFGQSDSENFAEGRRALDNFHDCAAAESALLKVSASFQANAVWIGYMARTQECLKHYDRALDLYRRYNALSPGNVEVLNKCVFR